METGFDLGNVYVTVDIDYKFWPGEPMVMYYPDGSGYPGSPAELEILDVIVTSVSGETHDKTRKEIDHAALAALDRLAWKHVEDDVASGGWISEHMFELENEQ